MTLIRRAVLTFERRNQYAGCLSQPETLEGLEALEILKALEAHTDYKVL